MIAAALRCLFVDQSGDDQVRIGVAHGSDARLKALTAAAVVFTGHSADGRPLFEAGVSGSFTHCGSTIAVAADPSGRPVGIDLETSEGPSLSATAILAHCETPDRPLRTVLAAKEAAGKAISTLTGERLDPRAIALEWRGDRFSAEPPHGLAAWSGQIVGGVSELGDHVVAAAISPGRRRGNGWDRP